MNESVGTPRTDAYVAERKRRYEDVLDCDRWFMQELERALTASLAAQETMRRAVADAIGYLRSPGARQDTVAKEMVAARRILEAAIEGSKHD